MIPRAALRSLRRVTQQQSHSRLPNRLGSGQQRLGAIQKPIGFSLQPVSCLYFHTSSLTRASGSSADEIMENLNDLYATAKDEFEIAAEGTEEKTVYAAEDREAAKEALQLLREAFEKAIAESSPEVAKEVQTRVGQRIRELANAVTAMEEKAMED